MQDQSQSCPSCRSNKYNNPQLKLMVNTCGHSLCENCVEVLFARGSGLCVQCKTPIRKVNFRYQLFEDPLVQKEVELRKKILSDFNKREDDFESLEDYDLYLEKIEDIIYNLMNDVDVDETKRYIENYKKENKDIIKRNRLKPSASMAFYESELEREAMLREQREREDQARRECLTKGANTNNYHAPELGNETYPRADAYPAPASALSNGQRDLPVPLSAIKRPPPPSSHLMPPSEIGRSRLTTPASSQLSFATPISAMPGRVELDRTGFLPPVAPATAFNTMVAPVSALPGLGAVTAWNLSAHHVVHLPPRSAQTRQPDSVLIPTRGQMTRSVSTASQGAPGSGINARTMPTPFKYEPYQLDMCGPIPPGEDISRWPYLIELYHDCIIRPLRAGDEDWKSNGLLEPSTDNTFMDLQDSPVKVKADPDLSSIPLNSDVEDIKPDTNLLLSSLKEEEPTQKPPLQGMSHRLPRGACGIAPQVFLERCLQESRCGLFL